MLCSLPAPVVVGYAHPCPASPAKKKKNGTTSLGLPRSQELSAEPGPRMLNSGAEGRSIHSSLSFSSEARIKSEDGFPEVDWHGKALAYVRAYGSCTSAPSERRRRITSQNITSCIKYSPWNVGQSRPQPRVGRGEAGHPPKPKLQQATLRERGRPVSGNRRRCTGEITAKRRHRQREVSRAGGHRGPIRRWRSFGPSFGLRVEIFR